jgi:pectate lyase
MMRQTRTWFLASLTITYIHAEKPISKDDLVKKAKENAALLAEAEKKAASLDRSKLAFQGAEGPGAYTQGGRGGRVIRVTTLDDTGKEGSLRFAVEQQGPRTIVFDTAGYISLNSDLVIKNPQITIDGSTAPCEGVCLRDGTLRIENTHDVVLRAIRVRPGDLTIRKLSKWQYIKRATNPTDGIIISNSMWCIMDHCSISWAPRTNLTISNSKNVSVQRCLIYEPLYDTKLGFISRCVKADGDAISIHKNLIATFAADGPAFSSSIDKGTLAAYNNLITYYTEQASSVHISQNPASFAFVNNHYVNHNDKVPEVTMLWPDDKQLATKDIGSRIYLSGNSGPQRHLQSMPQWVGTNVPLNAQALRTMAVTKAPFAYKPFVLMTASEVYDNILNDAGAVAFSRRRDISDQRIVKMVRAQRSFLLPSPSYIDHDFNDPTFGYPPLAQSDPQARTITPGEPTNPALMYPPLTSDGIPSRIEVIHGFE